MPAFPPLPTDPTREKPVISPVHTGCEFRTFSDGKQAKTCGFTAYIDRMTYSLSLLMGENVSILSQVLATNGSELTKFER